MRRIKGIRHVLQSENNKWVQFPVVGFFHCWGVDYEELEGGPGNHTVAIVEDDEGLVHKLDPADMEFTDRPDPRKDPTHAE